MDTDRDAICKLMMNGIYHIGDPYFEKEKEYPRAEALWGKWCDPRRVECPTCDGRGWNFIENIEEPWIHDDEECPTCYGTGKVRPDSAPVPESTPPDSPVQ